MNEKMLFDGLEGLIKVIEGLIAKTEALEKRVEELERRQTGTYPDPLPCSPTVSDPWKIYEGKVWWI